MIKNESQINQEGNNPLINSLSDKENIDRENRVYINNGKIKSIFNNSNNEKNIIINSNDFKDKNYKNENVENKININDDINIHETNKKFDYIPLTNSTYLSSKEKEIKSIEIKKEKLIFKPFYTAFSAKNIIKNLAANAEVSSFSLAYKSNTPKNRNYILDKLNKENIQNFIETNKNKPFFGSMLFKNNSHKDISKKFDKNRKEMNNNKILSKYSKEYKNKSLSNNINQTEKELNNILEQIKIKKAEIELNKEKGENENIKSKTKVKNKIPFNQKIFKKIFEEVKDEKNYIHKVVHRKLINQEYQRNSLINNNLKKYDTNTFNKEITTKKIKNPFSVSVNKDNKNINRNFSCNRNINLKTELNDINIKLNKSYANIINNYSNNINDEKFDNKKNSIKIKKIPLNKLKHKIQVNNPMITNYIYTCDKNNLNSYCYYNDMNCNTQRYAHNKNDINRFQEYSFNNINNYSLTQKYQRSTEIPKNNNSLCGIQNFNLENYVKEDKKNILYNKVNLTKRASKNIKINLNTNINVGNKYIPSEKIPKKNILLYNYENQILQKKKTGLFKKKLAGFSKEKQNTGDNNYSYLSLVDPRTNNNIYNKKMNNTIFKSYVSNKNKYIKTNANEINNYSMNINNRYNINIDKTYTANRINNREIITTEQKSTYDSNHYNINNIKSIGYQNLRNNFFNNEYENSKIFNYINEEIKLEQIITLLNLDDLLIIEDKLNTVLNSLKANNNSPEEFFDLFNYFFSSTLKPKFEQIYKYLLKETEAIKVFINNSLILIMICYDFSLNKNKTNNIKFSLYESIRLIYINLLMIISPIKNKTKTENKDFYNLRLIEMSGIGNIIDKNMINFNNNNDTDDDISFNRELLHNNTNLLIKNISLIIKNYKNSIISGLYYSIQFSSISLEEINNFFRQNILREDFIGCSVLASTFLKEKENFALSPTPYIIEPPSKKYSLVLDLDETLIHFKVNHSHNDEGVLKLRPGVTTFLEVIKEYYEIILFTEASEAYSELIMESFNKNNFFEYKFFRQHTIIIGQDFVKDLQRIGRPLDKTIIVDNIAQNFRMQKNNGILIKPFYGEDQNDQALIDLIPILINIAKDNIDVRNGLVKYRDEIMTKITSNLFGRNINKSGI